MKIVRCFVCVFVAGALLAPESQAALSFVSSESAFASGTNGAVQFSQFPIGVPLTNPFAATNTTGSIHLTESQATGNATIQIADASVAFPAGEKYLRSDSGGDVVISFDAPLMGFGVAVESASQNSGSFTISAFNGPTNDVNFLGSFSLSRSAGNHLTYLGVQDSQAQITTIILHDTANNLTHGHFALVISTNPPAPVLNISGGGPNFDLSWSISATGYHVQAATNLVPPINWQAANGGVTTNGLLYHQLVNSAAFGKTAFFRLSAVAP